MRRRTGSGSGSRWDSGSGSLLVLSLVPLLVVSAMVVLTLADAVSARHRAGAIADLSALAAASRARLGESAACDVAARISAVNEGQLRSCRLEGAVAEVTVSVRLSGAAAKVLPDPIRRARAGPPDGRS